MKSVTMSTKQDSDGFTTLCLRRGVKSRLESLKPYESMSWTEFADELADTYEENAN